MTAQPVGSLLPTTRITVMQGQARVSAGPRVELTTVLGSCIATCLYDPAVQVGGMNHFLLSEPPERNRHAQVDEHYGVYLMELLINEMLAQGATKRGMRAHLYGGAKLHHGMIDIGGANARFARRFLESERIPLLREDTGGHLARRVDFRPAHGQARSRSVEAAAVVNQPQPPRPSMPERGDVELF